MNLTPLEKAVLEMMLKNPSTHIDSIKKQLAVANVARREFTGVGFFTHFIVSADSAAEHDLPDMELSGVGAEFPSLKHGAGFVLFIRNGVVNMLEGFTYDEDWPDKTDDFNLIRTKAA